MDGISVNGSGRSKISQKRSLKFKIVENSSKRKELKFKAQIERKESKVSANNDEAKVSRTLDGTQKAFSAFMTRLKGILMYKELFTL